jgi:starch phosphorylase
MEIISHIDQRFRQDMQARGMQYDRINYLAPLGDGKIRMAWLACYGSFSINGVAALHTQIPKRTRCVISMNSGRRKFSNKTNGVTPRRC